MATGKWQLVASLEPQTGRPRCGVCKDEINLNRPGRVDFYIREEPVPLQVQIEGGWVQIKACCVACYDRFLGHPPELSVN